MVGKMSSSMPWLRVRWKGAYRTILSMGVILGGMSLLNKEAYPAWFYAIGLVVSVALHILTVHIELMLRRRKAGD